MRRDIDALVAEKVMGWRKIEGFWVAPGTPDWVNLYSQPSDPPLFSSDIAAAWQVVEKMTTLRPDLSHRPYSVHVMAAQEGDIGVCRITTWSIEGETVAAQQVTRSVPEAICLAALKALGVPVPETP